MHSKSDVEGLILNIRMLTPYQLGMHGRRDKYEVCDQAWIITGISFPSWVFAASSSYFVALVVLLRLMMIRKPLSFEGTHKTVSIAGCIFIWVLSILVPSVQLIVSFPFLFDVDVYNTFIAIQTYGLLVAPITLTVFLYVMLQCSIKQRVALSDVATPQLKALSKMTHGIVAGLIICNVPALLLMRYVSSRLGKETYEDVLESSTLV